MLAKALKRMNKEEKGFTLIELLAVIVILGIIAVIAVPMILGIINNTEEDADVATGRQVYEAARLYNIAEGLGNVDVTLATLITQNYLEAGIMLPSTKVRILNGLVDYDANGVLIDVSFTSDDARTNVIGRVTRAQIDAGEAD
ncbi:type II secretion system protein [Paenibacillus methanolicus]|uniref:Type IV pilus assembly protein PilA n=1 Tax=Paenibacillus methanolicus TaxID=582686 RepID=A0A5S5BVB1_9BACL|nr:type II secretion system protein [Paenibacillus methanolicus]TYP70110.1 type IV pilus assembly protein PilA [Paenibacillus methanolicus]